RTLHWVMDHRRAAMVFSLVILIGTFLLFRFVPKGFIPSEDTGRIIASTESIEGTTFEAMVPLQRAVAEVIAKDPAVAAFTSNVAAGGGVAGTNQGRLIIRLKERSHRDASADEVIRRLQPKVSQVPGIRVFLNNPPVINVGGRFSKSQYQYTLQGSDLEELYVASNDLLARLQDAPELTDVTSDLQISNPQVNVAIDRDRAAALGVTVQQIEEALYDAYGSRQVSTIFTSSDQYWVILELMPEFQRDMAALSSLYVGNRSGELVPLGAVARIAPGVGPLSVNHMGQSPSVTLSFNLRDGAALGQAVDRVERTAREALPQTVTGTFAGTAQAFQASQQGLLWLLLLAVLVIYLVLGILYESFIHPLTILSGLPFAGFGALLTLLLFRTELSIYAFVGI
ncbi:MAG TPA: efflux RND transporter permease subunit, partial [Candidatus Eisenbacteria bacterium]|nr:efflux RND transporter permease subunit [Candidatus Eisenbacteria bacterium]